MTFPDNIRAIHNFYCINTNNLIECPIFAENAKTMKKTFIFTLCSLFSMTVNAQNFSDYFEDKTLRADYIFTGDAKKTRSISGRTVKPSAMGRTQASSSRTSFGRQR